MSKDIYSKICELIDKDTRLVLARIIRKKGSGPRDVGTACIITLDRLYGTIGGGLLEHQVVKKARQVIESGKSFIYPFNMTSEEIAAAGMVCGGEVDVYLEPVFPENKEKCLVFQSVLDCLNQNRNGILVTRIQNEMGAAESSNFFMDERQHITGYAPGEGPDLDEIKSIIQPYDPSNVPDPFQYIENDDKSYCCFAERIGHTSKVLLFGGGHVSMVVSRLAKMVDFHITVVDDRAEFANSEKFPDADICLACDFDEAFDKVHIDSGTYILIITRGHLHDKRVLEKSLKTKAVYIGMIGSRKKRNLIFQALLENGFTESDLKRVVSPVGLDINAQTPEEIAVSIVAQLIEKRAPEKRERIL